MDIHFGLLLIYIKEGKKKKKKKKDQRKKQALE